MVTSTFQMLAGEDVKRKAQNQPTQTLVILKDKTAVTSSVTVADQFSKEHKHVLRDIGTLKKDVPNFGHMFFETMEADGYGRDRRVYLMNRDGFTLLAMGYTGKRAMKFKVAYIDAFNEMEAMLKQDAPALTQTQLTARIAMQQAEQEQQLNELTEDVSYLKSSMRINTTEEYQIKKAGSTQVIKALGGRDSNAYQDKSIRSKAYAQFWSEFKRHFKMARYGDLAKRKLDDALEFITEWAPDTELRLMIKHANQQLTMDEVD
ncbi:MULTISPECIES: Rha family transcriptional regulator [Exiguobacterium]|uniref:Rha family transcriptional regulator n=1 Tax=Exiguobacterium TaxID=33986 RepID=UPI002035FF21|nr:MULTISPECIES: Rha family transcriptional regulator [Exiguobacterium]MCT4779863.1 ORF6C domain-containing protein [Exiguobacterium soli]